MHGNIKGLEAAVRSFTRKRERWKLAAGRCAACSAPQSFVNCRIASQELESRRDGTVHMWDLQYRPGGNSLRGTEIG